MASGCSHGPRDDPPAELESTAAQILAALLRQTEEHRAEREERRAEKLAKRAAEEAYRAEEEAKLAIEKALQAREFARKTAEEAHRAREKATRVYSSYEEYTPATPEDSIGEEYAPTQQIPQKEPLQLQKRGQSSGTGGQIRCLYCLKLGHTRKDCRKKKGLCLACGSADHILAGCPNRRTT